jgi:hypothetical protein
VNSFARRERGFGLPQHAAAAGQADPVAPSIVQLQAAPAQSRRA